LDGRQLAILVAWEIWKERNARIFDRRRNTTEALKMKERLDSGVQQEPKKKLCDHSYFPCLRHSLVFVHFVSFV
jgi:hypothetical protein